jgi:hypothetical protein
MTKNIIKTITRSLTKWAWHDEIETCDSLAQIERLHAEPGSMELTLRQNPAMAQWVAHCWAAMLAKSPNYTELRFECTAPGSWDWIAVLVKKGSGKTPHQLREHAEKERDALKSQIQAALKILWGIGLLPEAHATIEEAARGASETVSYLRGELLDPPHDVQARVLEKLGFEGFAKGDDVIHRVVAIDEDEPVVRLTPVVTNYKINRRKSRGSKQHQPKKF